MLQQEVCQVMYEKANNLGLTGVGGVLLVHLKEVYSRLLVPASFIVESLQRSPDAIWRPNDNGENYAGSAFAKLAYMLRRMEATGENLEVVPFAGESNEKGGLIHDFGHGNPVLLIFFAGSGGPVIDLEIAKIGKSAAEGYQPTAPVAVVMIAASAEIPWKRSK